MSQYHRLFSFNYQHEYFLHTGSVSMRCVPSRATSKLLHNMGVIMRPSKSACLFLYDAGNHSSMENLFRLFNNEEMFFFLYPDDSESFFNYTANLRVTKRIVDKDTDKDTVIESCGFIFSTTNKSKIEGDVVNLEYGKSIIINKKIEDHKYLISSKLEQDELSIKIIKEYQSISNGYFPIITRINTNDLIGLSEDLKFQINFKSIFTYYKYYVCEYKNIKSLNLIDVGDEIEFIRSEEILENGMHAHVFTSLKPIKTLYENKYHFRLIESSDVSKKVIIDYVPLPKPGQYFVNKVNDQSVITSEVFIN